MGRLVVVFSVEVADKTEAETINSQLTAATDSITGLAKQSQYTEVIANE